MLCAGARMFEGPGGGAPPHGSTKPPQGTTKPLQGAVKPPQDAVKRNAWFASPVQVF